MSLLVVAGEASGDRAAAEALRRLSAAVPGVRASGLGGAALEAAGCRLVADLRDLTALGVGAVALRVPRILRAAAAVACEAGHGGRTQVGSQPIRAALLVNYTEFNLRLAPWLRARGVRVLWYGAPQVWAWRPDRIPAVRAGVDRMAVMLPFEEGLWREQGVDAHYVGHPALEVERLPRAAAREVLGLTPWAVTVAIMPGSRPHEVRHLLDPMLAAYERVRHDRASVDGRVLLATSLDDVTRRYVIRRSRLARVGVYDVDAAQGALRVLQGFDVALCASGTASLEAALAKAVPVVAYRVDLATELIARALLRSPYVALPNVVLRRKAFTELVQREVTVPALALALRGAIDRRRELCAACDEVATVLGGARAPSLAVAEMLAPWLRKGALGTSPPRPVGAPLQEAAQ